MMVSVNADAGTASGESANIEAVAAQLRAAYATGAIPPVRDRLVTVEAAYLVQQCNTSYWLASGRRIVGRKIGLTSAAVQRQLGVDQPDNGVLFADMEVPDGGELDLDELLQPKVEAEIAFVLGKDLLDANPSVDEVRAATIALHPALEIVDSRICRWDISITDTIADNASSARFVIGPAVAEWPKHGLRASIMRLTVDGQLESMGNGAACLGDPAHAVAWLATTLVARGEPLRAGDLVLSGALGPLVPLRSGIRVTALIEGLGEVSVQVTARGRGG